jgi:hypothetical protein
VAKKFKVVGKRGLKANEGLGVRESVLECGVTAPLSRLIVGNMRASFCVDEVERVVSGKNTDGGGIVADRGFYTPADHQAQQSGASTPHFRRRVCAMARQARTLSCSPGSWHVPPGLGLRRDIAAFETIGGEQNVFYCVGVVERAVSGEKTDGGGIVADRGFYTTADHQAQQSGAYTPHPRTLSCSRGALQTRKRLGRRRDIAAFETIGAGQTVFYCVGVVERVVSRENAEVGGVEQFASGAASEFVVSLDRHPQQSGADTPQSKTLSRTPMSGDYPAVFGLCNTAFAISDHGFGQAPSPLPVGYPPFTGSKSSGT